MSSHSIRVNILGRPYPLRAQPEHVVATEKTAAELDRRLRTFKEAHPEQSELTGAIITALHLLGENAALRKRVKTIEGDYEELFDELTTSLDDLEAQLREAQPRPADEAA
ncbi:MAG: cell division protein ZapA [Bacteroidota bacterium]